MLSKRMWQLESIDDELYQCVGEVNAENTRLDWDTVEMRDNNWSTNTKIRRKWE